MRLIKSHASGHKLIACRGQEEVSFSPHAALHNWLSAVSGGDTSMLAVSGVGD